MDLLSLLFAAASNRRARINRKETTRLAAAQLTMSHRVAFHMFGQSGRVEPSWPVCFSFETRRLI